MNQALAIILLDPIAAAWAGGLAGTGLVLLYFLRLRRKPVRVSSVLFWHAATADLQVNVPWRLIRPSWLFLLQAIILACLAIAIGRPATESLDAPGARVILVIDRSASMNARDPAAPAASTRTRLDLARTRAEAILAGLPSDTEAIVVALGADATAATNFTRDRGLSRQAIRALEPTDERGDLARAFDLVRALASQTAEGESAAPTRVVLLSDGTFDRARDPGSLGRADLRFEQVAPRDPALAPDNAGIVALAARRDYEDPAMVRLFVRVQSVTPRALDVPVFCRLDGGEVASGVLAIGAGSADAPAEASATYQFAAPEGGVLTVTLGREDDLAADDAAGLVLRRPARLNLLLVRPNLQKDALDSVVEAALEALEPATLRVISAGDFERPAPPGAPRPDLVVFDRVRPASLPAAPSISFGATLPIAGLGLAAPPADTPPAPTEVLFWQRSHPVMRYVSLAAVWVNRPMSMTLPDAAAPGRSLRTTVLASGAGGPLIALAEDAGVRRILVGFDLGDSNWVKDAGFHIFLKNATDFLTLSGEDESGRAARTGDPVSVRVAPGATRIEATGPVERAASVPETGADRATIGPFPRAGMYQLRGAAEEDARLPVSLLDPTESRLAAPAALDAGGDSIAAATAGSPVPREIWHWFVLAALAGLAVEWLLFAWRMRV